MGGKLTTQQKSYITTLRLWELGQGDQPHMITGQFLSSLRDGSWGSANKKQLKKLVDLGYLDSIVGAHNTVFYQLTIKGEKYANRLIERAKKFQWYGVQQSMEGFTDGAN